MCFERFDSDALPPPTRSFRNGAIPMQRASAGVHDTIVRVTAWWTVRVRRTRAIDGDAPVRPERSPVGLATSPTGLDRSPVRNLEATGEPDDQPGPAQRMTTGSDSTP